MLRSCVAGIRAHIERISRYLRDGRGYIAEANLRMLKTTSSTTFIVSILFFVLSPYLITNWTITREYWLLLPLNALAFLWSVYYGRKRERSPSVSMAACFVYNILLFMTFMAISIFPYPDSRQLYVGVWLLTMPVLFIFPPLLQLIVSLGSGALFCVLAIAYKTPEAVEYDIFAILFTFIMSWVIWGVLTHLQAESFFDKQSLLAASRIDSLTGALNKQAFEKHCATLYGGETVDKTNAFAMMDVDDFKQINDVYGHETGDRVLQCISHCVRGSLSPDDYVGRVGGDELAVLIADIKNTSQLEKILKRVTDSITAMASDIVPGGVTVSIGCVLLPAAPMPYGSIYRSADKLLYSAKKSGKHTANIRAYTEA